MEITYLKQNQINFKKWDACIASSFNGNAYAYSWFLDAVSENWEALVADNYSIVMPLTSRTKFKIKYLFQPMFTQQLGIFSQETLDANIVEQFINAIPKRIQFFEINLNKYNPIQHKKLHTEKRITYQLDLISTFAEINRNYKGNALRNIKKAKKNKITITRNITPNTYLELLKNTARLSKLYTEEDLNTLRKLISFTLRHKIGSLYGAFDNTNTLCAAGFFVNTNRKSIFLNSVSNDIGRKTSAMFLLIDYFIQWNTEKDLTLDFEGSQITGIADFYKSFGAHPYTYYRVRKNRLPIFIRFLKKRKPTEYLTIEE